MNPQLSVQLSEHLLDPSGHSREWSFGFTGEAQADAICPVRLFAEVHGVPDELAELEDRDGRLVLRFVESDSAIGNHFRRVAVRPESTT